MSLKFYTDTHIPKQVAIQLRQQGIEVIRCEEVGLAEASDEEHLEYAAERGLAVITKDRDFLRLNSEWSALDREHSGIFFSALGSSASIGVIVEVCLEYSEFVQSGAATLDDVRNQVIYVRR